MDVPFVSSGALNRAHYALVRKIESATSIQSANQLLIPEIKSRREQLGRPGLSLEQCKELLIILLYCRMTITHGFLPNDVFDFALPHAVGLAEAGQRLEQKRIGYLFCAEVMPPTHELQLMLVNTLRKDLESDRIPQICLALDNVIVSYNEDLIPAIQSRLHDLLSHTSPHVRRRALLAFYSLSRYNSELLTRISGTVTKRLEDPYQLVVSAALVISDLFSGVKMPPVIKSTINDLLKKTLADAQGYNHWILLRILRTLVSVGLTDENIPVIFELLRSSPRNRAVLRGAFLLLSTVSLELLLSSAKSGLGSPVEHLRPLLTLENPNDQYLFLACLECVEPAIWSGNSPGVPAVLEAWEVERVLHLLESTDPLIWRTTLKLLSRIDSNIVASYYSQALQNIPSTLSVVGKNNYTVRMLELLEIKSGEDGELYAQELTNLLVQLESVPPADASVLESAVERVLVCLRNARIDFRIQCATTLLTFALESELHLPQTLMVIITALAAEYCGKLSISPLDMLQGLAMRLTSCIPSVQDASLISMLRITADCSEVPTEIINIVTGLRQTSKRHVRQCCDQFLTYIHQKPMLSAIARSARSSSLPDFIEVLYSQQMSSPQPILQTQPTDSFPTGSKLRYQAYDTPSPMPKMRDRLPDIRSEADDSHGGSSSPLGSTYGLSRTLTAGELTLVSGKQPLELMSKPESPKLHTTLSLNQTSHNDSSNGADLIALNSEKSKNADTQGTKFERLWNLFEEPIYGARGWCDASVDNVVKSLQNCDVDHAEVIPANEPPFIGEVKMIMRIETRSDEGVIRLGKSEEDESCLWRVRSRDGALRRLVMDRPWERM